MKKNYLPRNLDVSSLLQQRSVFLLGPRQTGKSSYIREQLRIPSERVFNLLDRGLLLRVTADPTLVRQEIEARNLTDCIVCIDEIQMCPELLDEVQLLIAEGIIKRAIVVCTESRPRRTNGIEIMPWDYFLDLLWKNKLHEFGARSSI